MSFCDRCGWHRLDCTCTGLRLVKCTCAGCAKPAPPLWKPDLALLTAVTQLLAEARRAA